CQLLVTEGRHAPLLDGVDTGLGPDRTFEVESAAYALALDRHRGAALPDVEIADSDLYLLLFTSGTSGAPKACLCSPGRLRRSAPTTPTTRCAWCSGTRAPISTSIASRADSAFP